MLLPWAGIAGLLALAWYATAPAGTLKTTFGVLAGAWLLLGTLRFAWSRLRGGGRMTAEMLGMTVAHAGVALFFFGVLQTEGGSEERDVAAAPGQSFELRGYSFRFDGAERVQGPNYEADRGRIVVTRNDVEVATLHPEKRAYASGGNTMTEADLDGGLRRDLYVALGEPLGEDGSWALRLYVKPFIRWIWLGALLMAIGAFVVLFDRRFRRPTGAGQVPA
jgi:cytochrome c-type biogenesis protein CcmF